MTAKEGAMEKFSRLSMVLSLCLCALFWPVSQACGGQLPTHPPSEWAWATSAKPLATRSSLQEQEPGYQIEVQSSLVLLDVLVTDEDGNVLSGLKRGNFLILDEGKPQVISSFGPAEDPITMLLEYSGVAYDYFAYKGAYWSSGFLDHLGEKDWVALVTYDLKPTIQVDFTRNKADVQDALNNLSFPGFSETNIFDALIDTLDKLDRITGKKAILLITTGMNTFSTATLDDTLDRMKKSDATIFCVGLAESEYMSRSGGFSIGYLQAKNQLQTFADLTGGLAWFPRFEGELPSLFRSVVGFLRSEYDIGFSPPSSALDGRYHKLKVQIVGPDGNPLRVTDAKGRRRKITVYARDGYVATPRPDKTQ
jgi:VWFA-related protein